jgi:hypothetical protein
MGKRSWPAPSNCVLTLRCSYVLFLMWTAQICREMDLDLEWYIAIEQYMRMRVGEFIHVGRHGPLGERERGNGGRRDRGCERCEGNEGALM